ncbi:unnamed protein product [Notodromas monacha]|uniref:Phospholipid scramblase n=1 Tax=Notodromas monacha TaxID=399045 RepID=A0A7R9GA40_9CRUS|nr:unnamed protein product [Notodromas monacha]CAG0913291.1 unnamed protein product [Notodromas monacha]
MRDTNEMEVFSTPETHLGSIVQNWTLFRPDFSINDAQGNTVFKITGPFCTFSLCGEVEFSIFSARNGEEIGKISKQWSGLAAEAFTDADNFGIVFPHDLEVGMKAVLLAALFLITQATRFQQRMHQINERFTHELFTI